MELEIEIVEDHFIVSRDISLVEGQFLKDIKVKTSNGYTVSIKKLLRDMGEI